jgi:hypothetical protein
MRNVGLFCAALWGLTGAASAEEQGLASYFHYSRYAGLTAAHRTLPVGSQVRVVNLANGRTAVVTMSAAARSSVAGSSTFRWRPPTRSGSGDRASLTSSCIERSSEGAKLWTERS